MSEEWSLKLWLTEGDSKNSKTWRANLPPKEPHSKHKLQRSCPNFMHKCWSRRDTLYSRYHQGHCFWFGVLVVSQSQRFLKNNLDQATSHYSDGLVGKVIIPTIRQLCTCQHSCIGYCHGGDVPQFLCRPRNLQQSGRIHNFWDWYPRLPDNWWEQTSRKAVRRWSRWGKALGRQVLAEEPRRFASSFSAD